MNCYCVQCVLCMCMVVFTRTHVVFQWGNLLCLWKTFGLHSWKTFGLHSSLLPRSLGATNYQQYECCIECQGTCCVSARAHIQNSGGNLECICKHSLCICKIFSFPVDKGICHCFICSYPGIICLPSWWTLLQVNALKLLRLKKAW